MRFSDLKQDKGVAGLTILLSLIVMLFVIGLIVMIFSLMGSELSTATYTATTGTASNVTALSVVNETGVYLTGINPTTYRDCALTVTTMTNATDGLVIASGNYTIAGCLITYAGAGDYNNTLWNATGTYTYNADNTATDTMNDTVSGIAGVSDWFSIFIVIGAMVVLILLTVIIITAIRGSGMIQGGGTTGAGKGNVGSAYLFFFSFFL